MPRRTTMVVAGVAALAAAGIGTGVAVATGGSGGDSQEPITGDALTRATAVALDFAGGGRVTETEVGDEESMYQVEVTLDDGSQLDVNLDSTFKVVGHKAEGADSSDSNDNDNDTDGADD